MNLARWPRATSRGSILLLITGAAAKGSRSVSMPPYQAYHIFLFLLICVSVNEVKTVEIGETDCGTKTSDWKMRKINEGKRNNMQLST